ncbi:hypothetical protein KJQ97_09245, partial [Campylobacter sp. 2018MI01]|uniref:flagellin hook IN motif-containing protein n=2 Tax=unclassified Campylobacter TaxID=2593542 RepID=UPI001BDA50CF
GTFSNKEFQIGAYSNETVKASIGATTSDKIGLTRFETGHNVRQSDLALGDKINLTFKNVDGINDVTFEPVQIAQGNNIKAGQGLGALVEAINKSTDKTGIKASVTVQSVFEQPIKAGTTLQGFSINGVTIGSIEVKDKDGNGALRAAINSVKDQTGVEASVDEKGRLVLANRDGRGIKITDGVDKSYDPTTGKAYADNTAAAKVADKHVFYTDVGADLDGKNGEKIVDFSGAAAWGGDAAASETDPTGAAGSILSTKNSFDDVKDAYYEQAARHAADGSAKASTDVIKKAIKDGTEIDLSAVKAEKIGALQLESAKAFKDPANGTAFSDPSYEQALKDANAAVKLAVGDTNSKHATLSDANAALDNAMKALNKVIDLSKGHNMGEAEGTNGIIAVAALNFLQGVKEGLNESDRAGLKDMIGLTNDNKTNFGRLSFSSTNGKDIVVEATRDYVGADDKLHSMDVTSAIG